MEFTRILLVIVITQLSYNIHIVWSSKSNSSYPSPAHKHLRSILCEKSIIDSANNDKTNNCLKADDPQVIKLLRTKYLIPPRLVPKAAYNFTYYSAYYRPEDYRTGEALETCMDYYDPSMGQASLVRKFLRNMVRI